MQTIADLGGTEYTQAKYDAEAVHFNTQLLNEGSKLMGGTLKTLLKCDKAQFCVGARRMTTHCRVGRRPAAGQKEFWLYTSCCYCERAACLSQSWPHISIVIRFRVLHHRIIVLQRRRRRRRHVQMALKKFESIGPDHRDSLNADALSCCLNGQWVWGSARKDEEAAEEGWDIARRLRFRLRRLPFRMR